MNYEVSIMNKKKDEFEAIWS